MTNAGRDPRDLCPLFAAEIVNGPLDKFTLIC